MDAPSVQRLSPGVDTLAPSQSTVARAPAIRPVKPSSGGRSKKEILSALQVTVPESTLPKGYAVAMAVLFACLVMFSVMFAGLLVFLSWLAIWHVTAAFESLSYGPYFIFHVPMALLGALLVFFLIKPVFFRSKSRKGGVLTLEADDEPMLFAAVENFAKPPDRKCPRASKWTANPTPTHDFCTQPTVSSRMDNWCCASVYRWWRHYPFNNSPV